MGYISIVGKLDGSNQLIHTATTNMIITGGFVNKKNSSDALISALIKDAENRVIFPQQVLPNTPFELFGFKGLAMVPGDKLYINTDSSDNQILAECVISLYSDNAVGSKIEIPYYLARTTASCTTGGKILEITDFLPNKVYSVKVNSNISLASGQSMQLYKWINTPQFDTNNDSNMVFIGETFEIGGKIDFQIPSNNFYGFSLRAGNPNNGNNQDIACFTWDKNQKIIIINELITLNSGGGSR